MEQFMIVKPDGTRLASVLFTPRRPFSYLLIICHGFTGAKENSGHLSTFAAKLNQAGYGVLAFDFAGSGESDGSFASVTLSRQINDLHCVIDYAHTHYQVPLLLLGRSFGGSTILGASAASTVAGCIFWCSAILLKEVFRRNLGEYYERLADGETVSEEINGSVLTLEPGFVRDIANHHVDAYLQALQGKAVLVVHGLADTTVSPENGQYIKQKLPHAQLVLVPEADHRFTNHIAEREDTTVQWLLRTFPPAKNSGRST